MNTVTSLWDCLDAIPDPTWMTPTTYLIISAVTIGWGLWNLRGNPTKIN